MKASDGIYTYEIDFTEFVRERENGAPLEIDAEMFDYWLGVLPPVGFNGEQNGESLRMFGDGLSGQWQRRDDSLQRFSFAFAEGAEPITVFWEKDDRFFAQKTHLMNRG